MGGYLLVRNEGGDPLWTWLAEDMCPLLSMRFPMVYHAIHALLGALAEIIPKMKGFASEKFYTTN